LIKAEIKKSLETFFLEEGGSIVIMDHFYFLLNSFIFFLIVVDPLAVLPVFILVTRFENITQRRKTALKASLVALVVLVGFAFVGEKLLKVLTISTPALQIAGGILLLVAAIEMVVVTPSGLTSTTQDETKESIVKQDVSVFPLAIPLIAGPGAMTAVVMKMREVPQDLFLQGGILLMILLVILITYGCLYMAEALTKFLGVTGTNVLARVFGIILAALAVQFMLNGVTTIIKGF
jgi:multiple antibiotic resistance protein